jgi:hypothetical protein
MPPPGNSSQAGQSSADQDQGGGLGDVGDRGRATGLAGPPARYPDEVGHSPRQYRHMVVLVIIEVNEGPQGTVCQIRTCVRIETANVLGGTRQ